MCIRDSIQTMKSPFLCGDSLSAADIAFACAASIALGINHEEGYGCPLPSLSEMPEAYQQHATRWRQTPAGEFALRLFSEHRGQRVVAYGKSL